MSPRLGCAVTALACGGTALQLGLYREQPCAVPQPPSRRPLKNHQGLSPCGHSRHLDGRNPRTAH